MFIGNYFSPKFSDAKFICEFKWKDGAILLCSYGIVKLISPFLKVRTITNRLIFTCVVYSIFFAAYAFPFWVASFIQYVNTNVFLQGLIILTLVEVMFSKIEKKESDYEIP